MEWEIHSIPNGARLGSENYTLTRVATPFQTTLLYKLKNNFGIRLNVKWLNTSTDYLDNISRLANPNNNDNILIINFGFAIPILEPNSPVQKTN